LGLHLHIAGPVGGAKIGLGSLDTIGLGEARDAAVQWRRRLLAGADPMAGASPSRFHVSGTPRAMSRERSPTRGFVYFAGADAPALTADGNKRASKGA